jgi:hypothetical protein
LLAASDCRWLERKIDDFDLTNVDSAVVKEPLVDRSVKKVSNVIHNY